MAEHVGQRFGNYTLTRLLGKGGFAEVYLGEHIYLKSLAAIKVLLTPLGTDETARFLTEAQTLATLKHSHIVQILDFGIEGDIPFLVMEYAPNGSMQQRHPRGVPLAPEIVVPYVRQVASALQHAHNQKLIHRDVKPGNLLLRANNDLLLSDFGVAVLAKSTHQQSESEFVGTATYMAPEQIRGKACQSSDLYALAVVVYEWLSGDYLFDGSFTEVCAQHMFAAPASLLSKVPTLSPSIEQVVMIALAKDPSQRFSNVQAFATALEGAWSPADFSPVVQEASAHPENLAAQDGPTMSSSDDTPFIIEAIITQPGPTAPIEEHLAPQPVSAARSLSFVVSSWTALQTHLPPRLHSLKGLLILLVLLVVVLSGSGLLYYAYAGTHQPASAQNQQITARQTPTLPALSTPTTLSQPTATPTVALSATPTSGQTLAVPPTPTAAPQPTPTSTPTAVPTPTPTPKPAPQPTPTPVPACPPTVQSGSTGAWVRTLQQDLNSRGMTDQNGKSLVVDGDFGPMTQYAVKSWQKQAKIGVDGIVGPQTWHSLGRC